MPPYGSFPPLGKGWDGGLPGPKFGRRLTAAGVFQPRPGNTDSARSTTAGPHPNLPPKGEGGKTGLSSYDFKQKISR